MNVDVDGLSLIRFMYVMPYNMDLDGWLHSMDENLEGKYKHFTELEYLIRYVCTFGFPDILEDEPEKDLSADLPFFPHTQPDSKFNIYKAFLLVLACYRYMMKVPKFTWEGFKPVYYKVMGELRELH